MEKEFKDTLLLAGGLALFFYWLSKDANARNVAQGATNLVTNAAAGAVVGIGQQIGIPDTNVSKGQADVLRGDWWDASFDLPAADFLHEAGSAIGGSIYDVTHPNAGLAPNETSPAPGIIVSTLPQTDFGIAEIKHW